MLKLLLQQAYKSAFTVSSLRKMSTSSTKLRNYADAVNCLNSLQSNAATINHIRATQGKYDARLIPQTADYLKRIGYSPEDLNALNVIHITGTKGKGSTSAFCSSLLRTLAPNAKVGLYTSPHLIAVRERIRINGKPLDEDKFAKYFFDVWDALEKNTETVFEDTPEKPQYFRYLTIMAYHVFLQEKVDATILEVGIGGTYDTTNLVPKPLSTGVSALGIDHIFVLGSTIEEIAHQKGGIYKPGRPACTVQQPPNAQKVLQVRAAELKASSFSVIKEHPQTKDIRLGLAGEFQRSNASLAVALVGTFLASPDVPPAFKAHAITVPKATDIQPESKVSDLPSLPASVIAPSPLPEEFVVGLENAHWAGRCQLVQDRNETRQNVKWYLDGAHTVESLQCCGEWFAEALAKSQSRKRVLIFNCTSGRSAASLLGSLSDSIVEKQKAAITGSSQPLFDVVIFCTNTTYSDGTYSGDLVSKAVDQKDLDELTVQRELAQAWEKVAYTSQVKLSSPNSVKVLPSIQHAVELVTKFNADVAGNDVGTDVLVTGSLHLVGGIFEVAHLEYAL